MFFNCHVISCMWMLHCVYYLRNRLFNNPGWHFGAGSSYKKSCISREFMVKWSLKWIPAERRLWNRTQEVKGTHHVLETTPVHVCLRAHRKACCSLMIMNFIQMLFRHFVKTSWPLNHCSLLFQTVVMLCPLTAASLVRKATNQSELCRRH